MKLRSRGENQPELMVAALLHDVGKLRYRLNPLERAVVVLAKAVMPKSVHRWGIAPASSLDGLNRWRKAFVVAEQHPHWGAELSRQAGASSLTEALIRNHHNPHRASHETIELDLQQKLWLVDNET